MHDKRAQKSTHPEGSEVALPLPFGPVPSERQLRWHEHEVIGFLHFGVNTFTDKEWGYGSESPGIFAPTGFDADRIAEVAAAAGMAGLILTCKHHDGFCLWPSAYTEHSVKNSPWRGGKGDVVREISDACKSHGVLFGVYLSPWDRNRADYGRPGDIEYYRNQLQELTAEYGELFEVWFDGANGGDGYYGGAREVRQIDRRTYYDWKNTWKIVRGNQPDAVMFSDAGPDIRWVGNEKGTAGDPCWSTLTAADMYPGFGGDAMTSAESHTVKAWGSSQEMLNRGDRNGDMWLPAECDVSIRPGWFYHTSEDDKVRSPQNLVDLYFKSVGRGATLLLNVPPDGRGFIHENDARSLSGFRTQLDDFFDVDVAKDARITAGNVRGNSPLFSPENLIDGNRHSYWSTDDGVHTSEVVFQFPKEAKFNVVSLKEYLPLGQRVDEFAIDIDNGGRWRQLHRASAIGNRRLVRSDVCATQRVRLRILKSQSSPAISQVGLHLGPSR